ncbi:MAG: mechanosensitive ion channel family protein [Dehalococcoidia bacterium]|nr:mechanosensitive ion channel family protein [Dehalococcoidia bacterium]
MIEDILSDFQTIIEDPGPFLQFITIWGGGAIVLMLTVWLVLPPLVRGLLRSLDRVFPGGFEWLQADLSSMIVRAAWLIIVIATIEIAASFALGYSSLARGSMAAAGQWVLESALENALPVLLIVVGGVIAMRVVTFSVPRLVEANIRARANVTLEEEIQKNIDTLSDVVVGTARTAIVLLTIFLALSQIGVDLAPLIVAAGAIAVGVGFAVQNLIRDVLGGIFITLENQYRIGDVVSIAGIAGLVEDINLRRTLLRDLDYKQHTIPNGTITTTTNYTKDMSRVNMNIGVAYKTDMEHAFAVLNRIGKELAEEEEWAPVFLEPIQALRIDNFGDSAIEIKVLGEVLPIRQWEVSGEYRLRVKKAFDEEGIEIPFPHRTLYMGDASPETIGVQGAIMEAQQSASRTAPPESNAADS